MASESCEGRRVAGRVATALVCVVLASLAQTFPHPGDSGYAHEVLQVLCVDAEGEPLEGANVTIWGLPGAIVYSGLTNSTGWVSTPVPSGSYVLEVFWMGAPVFSRSLALTEPTTVVARCDVYRLTIAVNLLHIIPVRHASITIKNATSGRIVASHVGEIHIPYRLYSLSAEKTFRLPAGNYSVTVEMLGSQSHDLELKGSKKLVFAHVASLGSLFVLVCVLMAVISCVAFLAVGRKR